MPKERARDFVGTSIRSPAAWPAMIRHLEALEERSSARTQLLARLKSFNTQLQGDSRSLVARYLLRSSESLAI